MVDEKDRFGEKLHQKEKAEEDRFFAARDQALLEKLRREKTAAQLAELREIFAAQERRIAAGESYAEEDTRFHELIGQAARNELLTTMLGVVWDVLRASREQWLQTNQRAHESLDAHRRILNALSAHEPEAARRAAAEHITAVGEGILRLIGGSKV